jgi:hypothetical protein
MIMTSRYKNKKPTKQRYFLTVKYPYKEGGFGLGVEIENIVGRSSDESGTMIDKGNPGERDLSWIFSSKEAAEKMAKRIQQIKKVKISVEKAPV